jgi:hypothetical protein
LPLPPQKESLLPPQTLDAFVAAVQASKEGLLADALLNDWVVTDYAQGRLVLSLNNSKQKHLLPTLRAVVAQICGESWQVIVTEDTAETAPTLAERYHQDSLDQKESLKEDPFLRQALAIFNNCLLTQVLPHD